MKTILLIGAFAVGALALAHHNLVSVSVDGRVMSTAGMVVNGKLFIPAEDVAKAFHLTLTHKPNSNTATLVTSGGQDDEKGPQGKVGEWLFNGKTRLMLRPGSEVGERGVVYTIEVRNAEKKGKSFNFGFPGQTQLLILNAEGTQFEGELFDRNKDYSVGVQPATPYVVKFAFRCPPDFKAERLVIRIQTQISGQAPVQELFRLTLN